MRFGIPLLADRVAPRCTFADSILLVTTRRHRIEDRLTVPLQGTTWADLAAVLTEHEVDTLVCGGISPTTRASVATLDVEVIDNVAGTASEVLEALRAGRIAAGRAGAVHGVGGSDSQSGGGVDGAWPAPEGLVAGGQEKTGAPRDCLECRDRPCLRSMACPYLDLPPATEPTPVARGILEAAWDVAQEEERALCRLAELVYFALELDYRRIGVAFCEDLREPAAILTRVLRRFFEVVPVGCRMTGNRTTRDGCRPSLVAEYLNERETDLNVLVGLCVGADSLFARESRAPVTTALVKDKSLANNPIGALYSNYYLEDI
jgi:uncharacterized metal-binding protein/predicted Fe-Mo cluster-binding NifX family protein